MIRAMIDIEALAGPPWAVILEIGLVRNDGEEPLQVVLDIKDQERRKIDCSTLSWWHGQPDAWAAVMRRQALGMPLRSGLLTLARALNGVDEVWANSPSYDLVILACAMRQCHLTPPWRFFQERDFRTARALSPGVDYTPPADAHSALADAQAQADHLNKLNLWR